MRKVYFIKPIGMQGPFKIGCSISPDSRRSTLETWSPFPLEIVAEISGDYLLERRFHAHFMDTHLRREWFGWSREIDRVIADIKAGTFDIASLPKPVNVSRRLQGQRRAWTPEQKFRQAINFRLDRTFKRTGFKVQWNRYHIRPCDTKDIERLEAYLAAPHVHGEPFSCEWADLAREKYLASIGTGRCMTPFPNSTAGEPPPVRVPAFGPGGGTHFTFSHSNILR